MNINKIKKNYWSTDKNEQAGWYITLPHPKNKNECQKLVDLYKSIYVIGESLGVYSVGTKASKQPEGKDIYDRSQEIEWNFHENNQILSFGVANQLFSNRLFTAYSKLKYYSYDGTAIEKYVSNLGYVLLESQQIDDTDYSLMFAREIPPIDIDGGCILDVNSIDNNQKELIIYISLYTDIWFPWTIGIFADDDDPVSHHPVFGECYDNRELALFHTPLLNQFLSSTAKLVKDFGGTWEKSDEPSNYSIFIDDAGILLE